VLDVFLKLIEQGKKLLAEHGSATALRDHLAFVNVQLTTMRENFVKLERENGDLKRRCAELEERAARQDVPSDFVEQNGALFKRLAGGGYSDTPICPACKSSMWCFQELFPFECSNQSCKRPANFTGETLASVMAKLPRAR
jgi:hypothetical protein